MTDPFSQFSALWPTGLTSTPLSPSSQPNNSLSPLAASFTLLLAQTLIKVAQELERTAAAPASSSATPLTQPQANSFQSISLDLAQPYASGVATRAYQTASGWNFVPVYIGPTPAGAKGKEGIKGNGAVTAPSSPSVPPASAVSPVEAASPVSGALPLSAFPRPVGDNGRGMHWVPTVASTPQVVDQFVKEMADMNVKWCVFLNDGTDLTQNDYLVQRLVANNIEPVMRIYTPGLQPVAGDLGALVRHYKSLGVNYFQLYNEPNHEIENDGKAPDVNRYLDLWIPAARVVAENGGLPGFGALSPGGPEPASPLRANDFDFLRSALQGLKARGETAVLDKAWLSAHNYMGEKPLSNPEGLLRVQQYDRILNEELGRPMPIIGTEGGSFVIGPVTEADQTSLVTSAMQYMKDSREPYNFAYTYWVIANSLGGGRDPAWEWQALFQRSHTSPIVDALKGF